MSSVGNVDGTVDGSHDSVIDDRHGSTGGQVEGVADRVVNEAGMFVRGASEAFGAFGAWMVSTSPLAGHAGASSALSPSSGASILQAKTRTKFHDEMVAKLGETPCPEPIAAVAETADCSGQLPVDDKPTLDAVSNLSKLACSAQSEGSLGLSCLTSGGSAEEKAGLCAQTDYIMRPSYAQTVCSTRYSSSGSVVSTDSLRSVNSNGRRRIRQKQVGYRSIFPLSKESRGDGTVLRERPQIGGSSSSGSCLLSPSETAATPELADGAFSPANSGAVIPVMSASATSVAGVTSADVAERVSVTLGVLPEAYAVHHVASWSVGVSTASGSLGLGALSAWLGTKSLLSVAEENGSESAREHDGKRICTSRHSKNADDGNGDSHTPSDHVGKAADVSGHEGIMRSMSSLTDGFIGKVSGLWMQEEEEEEDEVYNIYGSSDTEESLQERLQEFFALQKLRDKVPTIRRRVPLAICAASSAVTSRSDLQKRALARTRGRARDNSQPAPEAQLGNSVSTGDHQSSERLPQQQQEGLPPAEPQQPLFQHQPQHNQKLLRQNAAEVIRSARTSVTEGAKVAPEMVELADEDLGRAATSRRQARARMARSRTDGYLACPASTRRQEAVATANAAAESPTTSPLLVLGHAAANAVRQFGGAGLNLHDSDSSN